MALLGGDAIVVGLMIIRVALAMPFGLGIFSSLMLIAGKTGYAAAFVCYLFMMAALALKPPAALVRRLGGEVEDAPPKEEKEPAEAGEGLVARLKGLPALVIAFLLALKSKLPFIGRKGDEDADDAPAAAPTPPVADEAVAAAGGTGADGEAEVEADGAVASVALAVVEEEEANGSAVPKLKFWGAKSSKGDEADDDEEDDESLMAPIRKVIGALLFVWHKIQKDPEIDMEKDDLIAAAADVDPLGDPLDGDEGAGNPLAFPSTQIGAVLQPSLVARLQVAVQVVTGKAVIRESPQAASTLGASAEVEIAAPAVPVASTEAEALAVVDGPVAGRGAWLTKVKGLVGKVVAREPGAAAEAPLPLGAAASDGSLSRAVPGGSLVAKLMPAMRSAGNKLVVARGEEAAAADALPKRPIKESLKLVVPAVRVAVLATIVWARGLRKDDFVPTLAAGWRVGGMAVLVLVALPLLAADLGLMRYRIRREELAEAADAAEGPDPDEVLLDTLVRDAEPAVAA